ncbi:hypothetical protein HK096_006928, partial [Nowakowskiella sp. JEL0078]
MGAIPDTSQLPWQAWDLIYFILFVVQFDILAFLVIYIDGFSWKKRTPASLVLHWALRSLGGVVFACILYVFQNDHEIDPLFPTADNVPPGWRWTTSIPTIGYYLGELFLDSYPFQKAIAVSTNNRWLKTVAFIGFIPLVAAKLAMIVFRYVFPFVGTTSSMKLWGDSFLSNLVKTTEIRMVASAVLTCTASTLIIAGGCTGDPLYAGCKFSLARNVAVEISYTLYYLDYLFMNSESSNGAIWPRNNTSSDLILRNGQGSGTTGTYSLSNIHTDIDTH